MDFARTRIGAPVPKVLAWNASPDNDVGCEYIIMYVVDPRYCYILRLFAWFVLRN
jgi:hypothetical protein